MKNRKTTTLILAILIASILPLSKSFAQADHPSNEQITHIKIKLAKEVNGEKVNIDTTFHNVSPEELKKYMSDHGIEAFDCKSHPGTFEKKVIIDRDDADFHEMELKIIGEGDVISDEEPNGATYKKIIITDDKNGIREIQIGEEGDCSSNSHIEKHIIAGPDGELKVCIKKSVIKDIDDTDKKLLKQTSNEEGQSTIEELKVIDVSIFPNPSTGRFNLKFELPEEGETTVRLLDSDGREVYFENIPSFSGSYDKEVDVAGTHEGVYFLSVTQNGKSMIKKVIIQ